jgi:FkbM family methyltransferase
MLKRFIKSTYHFIPFKKEIYTAVKLVWQPDEKIFRHLHFKDVFRVDLDRRHSFKIHHFGFQIENEIFWMGIRGGWEKKSMDVWIRLCSESSVIFDIGANTGVFALIAKTMNSNSSVYAFEPVKRVCEKLSKNIYLNGYDIKAVEKAVSDKNGSAIIYDTPTDHILSVTVNKNLASKETVVVETEIQTVSLNSFIKENNISKIDLMKIDVETHEPEVLNGFSDYLDEFKPTLLIEILNDEVGERVERIIAGMGYLFFYIDESVGLKQVEHIKRYEYYNYLLCSKEVAAKLRLSWKDFVVK